MTQQHRWPYWLLVAPMSISLMFLGLIMLISLENYTVRINYDCQLAEISPDFPMIVKEKCREIRRNYHATH